MQRFSKFQITELKKRLYYSCVHDSSVDVVNYDVNGKSLEITAFNSISNHNFSFIFEDVEFILFVKGNEFGNNKKILSLTVEDDYSIISKLIGLYDNLTTDNIYLLVQMFSGDEIHIVSKCVRIIGLTQK